MMEEEHVRRMDNVEQNPHGGKALLLFLLPGDFIGYKQALHPNFRGFEGLAGP